MKTKRIIAAMLAATVACAATVSASALDVNDVTPYNDVEVTANIVDPGTVNYTITIPATVDFGTLTQPDNTDADHYTISGFDVTATELNIKSNQGVSVYVKDSNATDNQFYISQKDAATPFKLAYDVYDTTVTVDNIDTYEPINKVAEPGTYGYHLCSFLKEYEGRSQPVFLALNQNALYGQNLFDIAGDYSGTITFHTALFER